MKEIPTDPSTLASLTAETVAPFASGGRIHARGHVRQREWLHAELAKLSPLERQIMFLHLAGESLRKIARQVGRTHPTVIYHLRRVRLKLAVRLSTTQAMGGCSFLDST